MLPFLHGPALPRVRPAALGFLYTVARDGRNGVVVTRRAAAGDVVELATSDRRAGVDWRALAREVLGDALDGRPPRGLSDDYARFIVTPRRGLRTIAGREIQAWLETWRPGLSALLGSRR